SLAARASSMVCTMRPFSPTCRLRSGEERLGLVAGCAEEHPHLGDAIAVEPIHERVAGFERVAVAAQRGVFPLGGPPVGADAELLVESDLAAGGFEPGSDHLEQPSHARVVARHWIRTTEMEDEVIGE